MRHGFPYKTQPCTHCRPEDLYCDWCLGSHREVMPIDHDEDEGKMMVWLWVAAIIALVILIIFGSE